MNYDSILRAFNDYIRKCQCQFYKELYVGVTNDIERRLFSEHNIDRVNDRWIYAPADSEETARRVESYFLDLGMRGGTGGGKGDGSSVFVYCYVITSNTVE